MAAVQKKEDETLTLIDAFCIEKLLPKLNDSRNPTTGALLEQAESIPQLVASLARAHETFLVNLNSSTKMLSEAGETMNKRLADHQETVEKSFKEAVTKLSDTGTEVFIRSHVELTKTFEKMAVGIELLNAALRDIGANQIPDTAKQNAASSAVNPLKKPCLYRLPKVLSFSRTEILTTEGTEFTELRWAMNFYERTFGKRSRCRSNNEEAVSLFPFMSILACLIGILTLMISVSIQAKQAESENNSNEERALAVENRDLKKKAAQITEAIKKTEEKLKKQNSASSQLAELKDRKIVLKQKFAELAKADDPEKADAALQ